MANITDIKTVDSAFVGASIFGVVNWHNNKTVIAERCHNFKGGFSSTFLWTTNSIKNSQGLYILWGRYWWLV